MSKSIKSTRAHVEIDENDDGTFDVCIPGADRVTRAQNVPQWRVLQLIASHFGQELDELQRDRREVVRSHAA